MGLNLVGQWEGGYICFLQSSMSGLSGTNKIEGGPFTREDPSDPSDITKKSCIDFVITSKELFPFIKRVQIDSDRKFTPCHSLKNKKLTYPDHYALLINMEGVPLKKNNSVSATQFAPRPSIKHKLLNWFLYHLFLNKTTQIIFIVLPIILITTGLVASSACTSVGKDLQEIKHFQRKLAGY